MSDLRPAASHLETLRLAEMRAAAAYDIAENAGNTRAIEKATIALYAASQALLIYKNRGM